MPPYIKRESKRCGNCVHFRQHYIKWGKDYYFPLEDQIRITKAKLEAIGIVAEDLDK